jgi:hypothetical protein
MTVSMYKVSVPIFVQFLTAQSECIDKAVAHIEDTPPGVVARLPAPRCQTCPTRKPAQIDGTEDKDITIKLGSNERKFTGQGLLQNFILPNFYFHCTTAYDILRHCGVELSKRDFLSTPVNL